MNRTLRFRDGFAWGFVVGMILTLLASSAGWLG